MDFKELSLIRQSCRRYDKDRTVEEEKLRYVLECALLSPSACNGQPYHVTVCRGESAKAVATAVTGPGMNRFAADAPVLLVISEKPYVKTAALGAKLKKNDYRSMDIGILSAYITSAAADVGLGTCILGWFDEEKVREICDADGTVRLVITLGYASDGYAIRNKKRKSTDELVTYKD